MRIAVYSTLCIAPDPCPRDGESRDIFVGVVPPGTSVETAIADNPWDDLYVGWWSYSSASELMAIERLAAFVGSYFRIPSTGP